jgi:hypothetical protein
LGLAYHIWRLQERILALSGNCIFFFPAFDGVIPSIDGITSEVRSRLLNPA